MFETKLAVTIVVAIVGVGGLWMIQHQARLGEQNQRLQLQLAQLSRVSAENQRLSNLLSQATLAQRTANDEFHEVLRLRSQLNSVGQEKGASNQVDQANWMQTLSEELGQLTALRGEVNGLSDEVNELRGAIEELYAAGSAPPAGDRSTGSSPDVESATASIRTIPTHAEVFAEALKRSVAAQDGETFQEVFGRFLQANGVALTNVTGAVFDERTGRVIVRATPATLDTIERLVVSLDRSP